MLFYIYGLFCHVGGANPKVMPTKGGRRMREVVGGERMKEN